MRLPAVVAVAGDQRVAQLQDPAAARGGGEHAAAVAAAAAGTVRRVAGDRDVLQRDRAAGLDREPAAILVGGVVGERHVLRGRGASTRGGETAAEGGDVVGDRRVAQRQGAAVENAAAVVD